MPSVSFVHSIPSASDGSEQAYHTFPSGACSSPRRTQASSSEASASPSAQRMLKKLSAFLSLCCTALAATAATATTPTAMPTGGTIMAAVCDA
eukprot:CAMPEP_0195609594 /NCGR_PEP_ID=MMETSP0815-20121206/9366_1 /TAXON_ID=97485 /ORGANISM="Prymnesium parvum, Strain Texoma1" /LENGTH=92 /DNA_ID=CAMNT_0040749541 /DNA_START=272 /DNA_END=550 /DNA_ORIENTATION=-